jgi:hypothetical protein
LLTNSGNGVLNSLRKSPDYLAWLFENFDSKDLTRMHINTGNGALNSLVEAADTKHLA